jgi:tetratricopeptide (TPR) repeat protein
MRKPFILLPLFLMVLLGILEGYFRFFAPIPTFKNHTTAAFGLPTAFRSNISSNQLFVNFPFQIQTNSKNLRSWREIPYEKTKNTFRILCIGGSIFAASGVNNDETFAYYLDKKLNANGSKTKFEVINAGKNTWELADFFTYFKNEGYKYQPDLIIIYFHTGELNVMDFSELEATQLKSKRLSSNQTEIKIKGLNFNQRLNLKSATALNFIQSLPFYDFFFSNFHLARALEKQIRKNLVLPKSAVPSNEKSNLESFMRNWDLKPGDYITWKTDYGEVPNLPFHQAKTTLYSIALERFLTLAEKSKTKVLFLSVPSPKEILGSEVNFQETKPFRITKNPNLYWLELLNPLKEIQDSSMIPLNFPNKIHWTPAGHNAAATLAFNFISEKKLAPFEGVRSHMNTKDPTFIQNLERSNNRIDSLIKNQGYDLYIKGMASKNLNKLDQAETFLNGYLEVAPQSQKIIWQLANLYFLKKEFNKSIDFVNLAIEKGYPKSDAVYALVGKSYFNLRQLKKAEVFFKKALDYSPNYFRNRLNYARLLFSEKRYDESLSQLLTANTLFPNQTETLIGLASVYLKLGQNKKAKETLHAILKIDPQNQLAIQGLEETK